MSPAQPISPTATTAASRGPRTAAASWNGCCTDALTRADAAPRPSGSSRLQFVMVVARVDALAPPIGSGVPYTVGGLWQGRACGGPTYQMTSMLFPDEVVSGRTRAHLLGDSGPVGSEILLNVSCGAAPIAPHYLLTAAHCVLNTKYLPSSLHLEADDLTNPESAKYDIEEITYHPDYNPNSAERYNDIAIIKTIQPMRFSDRVYPFCVPSEEVGHNTPVTVQGYGLVNETSSASFLQEAQLFIVGQQECERAYEREGSLFHLQVRYPKLLQNTDVICAAADKRDACQGDSGGPLFVQDREGRRFIVGIVSSGKECGSVLPGTYISVAKHINFIDSVLYNSRN
ncbi:serine protease [Penaeus vannamei]|uniref:Serine protease n=1 Tax=Penaeus vannamei TaxID=6689 RepID=A0A3R7PUI1_PENVA|nr:serine protease [Penaeus vannamei]